MSVGSTTAESGKGSPLGTGRGWMMIVENDAESGHGVYGQDPHVSH